MLIMSTSRLSTSRLPSVHLRLIFAIVALGGACTTSSAGDVGSATGGAGTGGARAGTQGTGGLPGPGGAPTTASGGAPGTGGASDTIAPSGSGGAPGTGGAPSTTGTGGLPDTGAGGLPGSGGAPIMGAGGAAPPTGGSSGTGLGGAAAASDFGIGGPSRCAASGVALCESFENGLSSTIWSTMQSGDATAVVDSMQAARGTKALHVKTTAGNGHAYVTEKMTFPAMGNVLYGRMFVYLGDPLTTNGHFSFVEGDGTGSSGARFGGQNKFLGVGTDGASGDWTDKDNKLIPAQTWMCLEFEFSGVTNDFHGWWDDVERTALHRGAAQHPGFVMPQFNAIWFGWYMYNATEPQDLWIDEIAIDFKPIGCTK
jgi:hypothetical protein